MTLTFLIIYCVLIIGACSNSTKGDSTTSSTSMLDYETTTLAGKIAGVLRSLDQLNSRSMKQGLSFNV